MKQNYLLLFVMLLMTTISACDRNADEIEPDFESPDAIINKAKEHHVNYIRSAAHKETGTDALDAVKTKKRKVRWDDAKVRKTAKGALVISALDYEDGKVFHKATCNAHQRLIEKERLFTFLGDDGTVTAEVVATLESSNKETFLRTVIVEDWHGNFIKGFNFEGNKVRYFHFRGRKNLEGARVETASGGDAMAVDGEQCFDVTTTVCITLETNPGLGEFCQDYVSTYCYLQDRGWYDPYSNYDYIPEDWGLPSGGGGGDRQPALDPNQPCPGDVVKNPEIAPSNNFGNIKGGRRGYTRIDRETLQPRWHDGLDIKTLVGTPIYAMYGGVVKRVESNIPNEASSYCKKCLGNLVEIETAMPNGDKLRILYAHMSRVDVIEGPILGGTILGLSGKTGNAWKASHPHVHLEMKLNGVAVNPEDYLSTKFDNIGTSTGVPCN